MNSFYSREELMELGIKSLGNNVLISKKASIYNQEEIVIGNNVRIDDFCILSGKIEIGDNIHISAYSALFAGQAGIEVGDYTALSARTIVYAISDDYSGEYMTNPTVASEYRNVKSERVKIKKHVIVGTSTVILPGVTLEEGVAIGACSLVLKNCPEWTISAGIPAKIIKARKKELLKFSKNI